MNSPRPCLDQTQPGFDALRASIGNQYSRHNFDQADQASAGWRLGQRGAIDVQFSPKFKLDRRDAIFTMGSCFARNVEESMIREGIRVLLKDFDFPQQLLHPLHKSLQAGLNGPDHARWLRTVLNKYTTHSMLNEFERILTPERFRDPFRGLIKIDDTRWFDPQINNLRNTSLDEALIARDVVESAAALVTEATAIFLTLGFTETWYDTETKALINAAPPPALIRRFPERFQFFNATHAQSVQCLEELYGLLTAKIRKDMKFVVTVSPIPLATTFTTNDILVANAYSKATLRSAAGEFASRYDNVDYFPSYEMIVLAHPEVTWEEDRVHVRQPLIDTVIRRFVQGYVDTARDEAAISLSASASG